MNTKEINKFSREYETYYKNNKESIFKEHEDDDLYLDLFKTRFSISKLKKLTIGEYVFEKGNKDSFCYWMDNQLDRFCSIHINKTSGYQKYHLQKINSKYIWKKKNQKKSKFGNSADEVFKNVKDELVKLVNAVESNDIDTIKSSRLYSPTAAKITYIYSPNKWVPILVNTDVDNILSYFGICFDPKECLTEKRIKLFKLYENIKNNIIVDFTTVDFMRFIYTDDNYRKIVRRKPYTIRNRCKPIKKIKTKTKRRNNENMSYYNIDPKHLKQIGTIGEILIYEELKKIEKKDKAKLDCPCLRNEDDVHYDFKLEYNNRTEYIEVKSTVQSSRQPVHFFMSEYEYDFLKNNINNYKIYYVTDVLGDPEYEVMDGKNIFTHLITSTYKYK